MIIKIEKSPPHGRRARRIRLANFAMPSSQISSARRRIKTVALVAAIAVLAAGVLAGALLYRTRAIPVRSRGCVVSPDGHRAYLSVVKRKGVLGGEAEFYLFEVEMVLPDDVRIPVARHELQGRHVYHRINWEDLGKHIKWSKRHHAFTFVTGRKDVTVPVPF